MRDHRGVLATTAAIILGVVLPATAAQAAAWTKAKPAAAPFSWNPGKALAATNGFVLSAWSSDCPPPKGACARDHGGPRMGVWVQRAPSRGANLPWHPPARVSPGNRQAERAVVAANGSRAIVGWVTQTSYQHFRPTAPRVFQVRVSSTQGRHWGPAKSLSNRRARVDYPRVAVAGSRLYAVWTDAGTGKIRLAISANAGGHWITRTIGHTAARGREGFSGLPDVGASGQNVAVTWYANRQGKQVALVSSAGGSDLGPGSTPVTLTTSGPAPGLRYGAAAGATDGSSDRVALAYTTGTGVATRVWDGASLGPEMTVASWPFAAGGRTYAGGYGPAVLPVDVNGLQLVFAGCRLRAGLASPCTFSRAAARIDVVYTRSTDGGTSWSAPTTLTDAGKAPYRTNDEPSIALGGGALRVAYDRYERKFTDYRVWIRSST